MKKTADFDTLYLQYTLADITLEAVAAALGMPEQDVRKIIRARYLAEHPEISDAWELEVSTPASLPNDWIDPALFERYYRKYEKFNMGLSEIAKKLGISDGTARTIIEKRQKHGPSYNPNFRMRRPTEPIDTALFEALYQRYMNREFSVMALADACGITMEKAQKYVRERKVAGSGYNPNRLQGTHAEVLAYGTIVFSDVPAKKDAPSSPSADAHKQRNPTPCTPCQDENDCSNPNGGGVCARQGTQRIRADPVLFAQLYAAYEEKDISMADVGRRLGVSYFIAKKRLQERKNFGEGYDPNDRFWGFNKGADETALILKGESPRPPAKWEIDAERFGTLYQEYLYGDITMKQMADTLGISYCRIRYFCEKNIPKR